MGEIERAKQTIDAVPKRHPMMRKYHKKIEKVAWESCAQVLDANERKHHLLQG